MISRPALHGANIVACFRTNAEVKHGIHAFATDALNSFLKNFKGNSMPTDMLIGFTNVAKEMNLEKFLSLLLILLFF